MARTPTAVKKHPRPAAGHHGDQTDGGSRTPDDSTDGTEGHHQGKEQADNEPGEAVSWCRHTDY